MNEETKMLTKFFVGNLTERDRHTGA